MENDKSFPWGVKVVIVYEAPSRKEAIDKVRDFLTAQPGLKFYVADAVEEK